ncbi:MAG: undecaprenyl-diphosphate phosphatase [Clostridia bacterium]|nr:undecaprenyl-diphosphate phosphatase [Clostridia bacterium]
MIVTFFHDLIRSIILGIVEGITEWLPISSTGHLIIVQELIGYISSDAFMEMFNVVIQLGAILAVVVIYFKKLNPFDKEKTQVEKNNTISLWIKVIVACIPAAVIGLLLDDWMDEHLFNPVVVAIALIVYGIAFIVIENNRSKIGIKCKNLDKMPLKTAVGVGLFQVLALVPGTSRSGSTILGGLLLGTTRYVATEFTFFLAIPVMFGASLLKLFKFGLPSFYEFVMLVVGMFISFVVSVLAIKFLLSYIKKNSFKIFGYYRIALGIIVLLCAIFNII